MCLRVWMHVWLMHMTDFLLLFAAAVCGDMQRSLEFIYQSTPRLLNRLLSRAHSKETGADEDRTHPVDRRHPHGAGTFGLLLPPQRSANVGGTGVATPGIWTRPGWTCRTLREL